MLHTRKQSGGQSLGMTDRALDIAALKTYVASTGGLSMEAADLSNVIKQGTFDPKDIDGLAMSFESHVLGDRATTKDYKKNDTALQTAGLLAAFKSDPRAYLNMFVGDQYSPEGAAVYATSTSCDYPSVYQQYSAEAFDNQSLTDNLAISIGLTYNVARQGHAMELIYRLIALTPDQGAVDIEFTNLYVQNAVTHSATGDLSNYASKRVIDASIDHRIVSDNITKIIPQVTSENQANFVPAGVVAPFSYTDETTRRVVSTSALITGKQINLLGIGHLDQAARSGQADYRDSLDRNLAVEKLFLTLGTDTLMFDLKGIPYTRFVKSPEQGSRELKLNTTLTSLYLDKDSLRYDDSALTGTVFETIRTGDYRVRLRVELTGSADVEKGWANVNSQPVTVFQVLNSAGAIVEGSVADDIIEALEGMVIRGWWPDARVTNSNHRYLGQLLNTRGVRERLVTRTRSPVFVPFPTSEDRDQTVLDWLTYYVGKQINADGITKLFDYHQRLTDMLPGGRILGDLTPGDFEINALPMEGVARNLINPYIDTVEFDVTDLIQTRFTMENIGNAIETINNQVRAVGFNILQKTNYENACAYIDGGEITRPWKFAFVTSNYIMNFLTKTGDTRTFGAGLPFDIRADVDARLEEVMFMTLVREGEGVDPLSAGILLYTPSLVATITTTRNGGHNKEAIMQPRYEHYNLLPILVRFNIKGVKEILENLARFQVEATIVDPETDAGTGGTGGGTGGTGPVAPGTGAGAGSGAGTGG